MNLRIFLACTFMAVLLLNGCTSLKAIIAMQRSTDHFIVLEENPAIRYEAGAKNHALKVAQFLEKGIVVVESKHSTVFPDDVLIYLPNTIESFSAYTISDIPRATVIGGKLFLSPRLFNGNDTEITGILIHELSHLLMTQKLGRWDAQRHIPHWFAEGLAVYVSGGAGAEKISIEEAILSIRAGKAIVPGDRGAFLFGETAGSFDLTPHMFYRQSSMYVTWLHQKNPVYFKKFLHLIYQGNTVGEAMLQSFGFFASEGWNDFIDEIANR